MQLKKETKPKQMLDEGICNSLRALGKGINTSFRSISNYE